MSILLLGIILLVPLAHGNGEYDKDSLIEAGALGEAAAWGAGLSTIQYMIVRRALPRFYLLEPRYRARLARLSLDIHSYGNLASLGLGLSHGYINRSAASLLEYLMVGLAIILAVSGLTMRYLRDRRARLVARMIHGQRILALLLLTLVIIHVSKMED